MKIKTTSILENAVLFSLSRRSWGNSRTADKSHIKTTEGDSAEALAADEKTKRRLHITKRLISDCPELDAVYDELGDLYNWCLARCMQSCLREGVYFVKKDMVKEFEAHIEASNKRLKEELIPAFLAVYDSAIEKAKADLNGQFRASDYPSANEMRCKFGTHHSWLEFNVPKDLPEEVKQRETKKLKEQMDNAATEIVFALRESFAGLVEDLARRMEVQPGTPGKRFTAAGAVDNLKDFISRFQSLNIANDAELEAAIVSARAIVENKRDIENLKESKLSRDRIKTAIEGVKATCATLIADRPKRKITFED